jgi:hypothetical protein
VQNNASSASLSHHLWCSRASWSGHHQRRSVCTIAHVQGVHIPSEHRAVPVVSMESHTHLIMFR